jgi:hypothetical protein
VLLLSTTRPHSILTENHDHITSGFAPIHAASPEDTPDVFYFRLDNYDSTDSYDTFELRNWDVTLNLFDSPADVIVSRLDISGEAGSTVEVFPKSNPLALDGGESVPISAPRPTPITHSPLTTHHIPLTTPPPRSLSLSAMYLLSNTTGLGITDVVSGTNQTAEYEDAITWMR